MCPELVVAAAIVDDLRAPTTLLAARRSAPPDLAGAWELPGGKVEPDEVPVDALHRELAEELGVTVTLGTRLPRPATRGPRRYCWPLTGARRMQVWWAVVADGVPAARQDHDELRVLGPCEWESVPWLAPDVPIIAAAARFARGPVN